MSLPSALRLLLAALLARDAAVDLGSLELLFGRLRLLDKLVELGFPPLQFFVVAQDLGERPLRPREPRRGPLLVVRIAGICIVLPGLQWKASFMNCYSICHPTCYCGGGIYNCSSSTSMSVSARKVLMRSE